MNYKNTLILFISFLPLSSHAVDIMNTGQQSLEFHGYVRTGIGMSEDGTTQAKFQAPGTRAAYRLGNEPDTNMELQFNYNYKLSDADKNHVQGIIMLDGYKTHGSTNDFTISNLAQGYLSFNQFFNNDIKLWLGRRYYDRKGIHINDHTWLNPGQGSQAGLGIEDISVGSNKLNIALFRYEDTFNDGTDRLINSTALDIRLRDINLSDNSMLTLWADVTKRHKYAVLNYANKTGYGLGGWVDYKSKKTSNSTAMIYQKGASIRQGDYNAKPIREDISGVLWNLDKATAYEINNTLTYESSPDYAFQWTVLYRQEDHGTAGDSKVSWISTGIRPLFYLSKHMNIALEAGYDSIDDKLNDLKGSLTKVTAALQVSADRGFYSRPVLRFFATFAKWSDSLKGQVGNTPTNAPYANNTSGWTIGAQAEVWW